jgi:PTS system N-acetylglucosamine-specific IIC component
VPVGIASGLIGGVFYNRFSTFKLPEYLAFFSGRRFVPIISGPGRPADRGADRPGL